ncbi:jg23894 [Pararge aegeria aegeria]|uniref:Jg23894 protein n=1 Tax=Pararge aegeria aegeria TaxID=348720 RepID=A0A8S4S6Q0_9NEOP|nr:jg23894 [Pararge aegeria aegeria]
MFLTVWYSDCVPIPLNWLFTLAIDSSVVICETTHPHWASVVDCGLMPFSLREEYEGVHSNRHQRSGKYRNLTLMPIVCPGTTDMMEIRSLGIPAFGFTTTRNVDLKAHDIDEYIPIDTYLEGIALYATLIQRLASLP